jgi:hypothetical protein
MDSVHNYLKSERVNSNSTFFPFPLIYPSSCIEEDYQAIKEPGTQDDSEKDKNRVKKNLGEVLDKIYVSSFSAPATKESVRIEENGAVIKWKCQTFLMSLHSCALSFLQKLFSVNKK